MTETAQNTGVSQTETPRSLQQGRYQLRNVLGHSLMARTYDALDTQTSTEVIIKELVFKNIDKWKPFELFQREADVLARLHHPAIPRLLDRFETSQEKTSAFYLVQQKLPGLNLRDQLEQGWRVTEDLARDLAQQVLDILAYLHQGSEPVIHRDIKPSNLLRDETGQVYLIDFGAVQDLLKAQGHSTLVGTFGYMPLEQMSGRALPASDLYSLGATLVHLLSGRFPAELPQEDLKLDFKGHLQVSPALMEWLDKLLEPMVEDRFQTALEAAQALTGSKVSTAKVSGQKPLEHVQTEHVQEPVSVRSCNLQEHYSLETALSQTASESHSRGIKRLVSQSPSAYNLMITQWILDPAKADRPLALVQAEANRLLALDMPGLARVTDAFTDLGSTQPSFYLVREWIQGESLSHKWNRGWRATEVEACDLARQILDRLVYLQSFSPAILHRRIEPDNLMIDRQGKLWLLDFGLSACEPGMPWSVPEALRDTLASDLYSLGATLIYLLTGASPSPPPELQVSQTFQAWLKRLLAVPGNPLFESAGEALMALDKLERAANQSPEPWKAMPAVSHCIHRLQISYTAACLEVTLPDYAKSNHKILHLSPYQLIWGNFFLPTTQLVKVQLTEIPNMQSAWGSAIRNLTVYWPASDPPTKASWLKWLDYRPPGHEPGLALCYLVLGLQSDDYNELVAVITAWLRSHNRDIRAANHKTITQAPNEWAPPLNRTIQLSWVGEHPVIENLAYQMNKQRLTLSPEALIYTDRGSSWSLSWNKILSFKESNKQFITEIDTAGSFSSQSVLSLVDTDYASRKIFEISSHMGGCEIIWLKEILSCYLQAHR